PRICPIHCRAFSPSCRTRGPIELACRSRPHLSIGREVGFRSQLSAHDLHIPHMRRFDPDTSRMTLFSALLHASARYGADRAAIEDVQRAPLTYRRLIQSSLVLGGKLASITRRGENVGVMLPNVVALPVTIFAL